MNKQREKGVAASSERLGDQCRITLSENKKLKSQSFQAATCWMIALLFNFLLSLIDTPQWFAGLSQVCGSPISSFI
jgi:hypothetical protein